MGAVDRKTLPIQPFQKRAFYGTGAMYLIHSPVFMAGAFVKMLAYIAAEINIDHLHSFADSKNRLSVHHKGIQNRKLEPVEFRVKKPGAAGKLPKQLRVNVPSSGQNQAIIITYIRNMKRCFCQYA